MPVLGIDVSHWDDNLDFKIMKQNGVEWCCAKATQGNYKTDDKFKTWAKAARDAGMVTALYHWVDPAIDDKAQCDYFINTVKPFLWSRDDGEPAFTFVMLDVEQSTNNTTGAVFSKERIAQCVKDCAAYIKRNLNMPVAIYTRFYFIQDNAPAMTQYLAQYPLWLAQYPYATSPVVNAQWKDFLPGGKYEPKANVKLPIDPNTKLPIPWTFWQFTGDKFRLPGTGTSQMDVNFYSGTLEELWLNFGNGRDVIVPNPQPVLTLEQRVAKLEAEAKLHGWNI